MRALPLLRREAVNLEHFEAVTVALLAIVPTAEVSARRDLVRTATIAEDIAVIFFPANAGLQQRTRFDGART